jgi:arsenite methyltransferase
MPSSEDKWKKWLLEGRFAGDAEKKSLKYLGELAETLLGFARLKESEVLLDVGAGDGLIAFAALPQLGKTGRAILSDISRPLLEHVRSVALGMEVLDRCEFVEASADDLTSLADASVDIVTTRSVLIYVRDKPKAFREFFRVLKSQGRIALWEPVHAPWERTGLGLFDDYAVPPIVDLVRRLWDFYRRLQPPDEDPMLNFDEWDLVRLARLAGFETVIANLSLNILPGIPTRWEDFIAFQANPNVPALSDAIGQIFSNAEREMLETHLRPLIEQGRGQIRQSGLFLWAWKPGGWSREPV